MPGGLLGRQKGGLLDVDGYEPDPPGLLEGLSYGPNAYRGGLLEPAFVAQELGMIGAVPNRTPPRRTLPMDVASRLERAREMGFDIDHPVYHGTVGHFRRFDPRRVGLTGESYGTKAYWFADSPVVAGGYATAGPLEVRQARRALGDAQRAEEAYRERLRGLYGLGWEQPASARAGGRQPTNRQRNRLGEHEGRIHMRAHDVSTAENQHRTSEAGRAGIVPGANVMPVYLRMKNPLVVDAQGRSWDEVNYDAVARARAGGHDGLIIRNVIDSTTAETAIPTTIRAVFNPSNIRSINARFDPQKSRSHDILSFNAAPGAARTYG